MTIRVGCSGWSYDDWVGPFYPVEMANKKGGWFDYYTQYFSTVEINSTFYRPPGELQVNSWIKKAKDKKGFEYSVKVPQLVTHKALVEGDKEKAIFWATSLLRKPASSPWRMQDYWVACCCSSPPTSRTKASLLMP
jgi:uncharacterized protein YecE (DUF72 family)